MGRCLRVMSLEHRFIAHSGLFGSAVGGTPSGCTTFVLEIHKFHL